MEPYELPTPAGFIQGVAAFRQREQRDSMYRVATYLVEHFWCQPRELADAIGVLLLTWNQAHYRYGPPSFERIEGFLLKEQPRLESFRHRDIRTVSVEDVATIRRLFDQALVALEIAEGKSRGRKSPVAVAKALHLLAPAFFPLWDNKIAGAYGCSYTTNAADCYIRFIEIAKRMTLRYAGAITQIRDGKTQLKVLDEYNYARFTQRWI